MHISSESFTDERRGNVFVDEGMFRASPESGQLNLTEEALRSVINTDPIEDWYDVDPEPIASGQFAVVYHCRHRITGEEFAAKFANKRRLGVDATPAIIHEITVNAILASCASNIKLQDVFATDKYFILVMEFASGGDLQTLVDENVVFYERHVISFLRQLLEGLVFIHDKSIVHLDIKPQNLVLMGEFPDCAVKLCDFEIARLLTPGYEVREIRGTPDYVAPEILHYEPITTKTDMWSLGVLTYVLLTGFLPFGGDSDQATFMQISWGELDFPTELFEDVTPDAIDFMRKLLIRDAEQRMTARECLSHPWLMEKSIEVSTETAAEPVTTHPTTVLRAESSPSVVVSPLTEENLLASQSQGRPPLHPRTSQKSLCGVSGEVTNATPEVAPLPAVTSFLNKESRMGSRQNLNRLRTMSKSREVLSERIQMSKLKKSLSKSRERLFDARIDMSASREDLLNCQSLSQSVEALTALTQLHQNGALYKSCNNIFIPMIHLVKNQQNTQERMYKSLASINNIPNNDLSKLDYYDAGSNDDFNDLITMRNTNMNIVITDSPYVSKTEEHRLGGLRGNPCRGGRSAEGCDRICQRHKQPEPQSTQNIRKLSRSEKMKKDVQKRRKEKKEQDMKEKEKQRKLSLNETGRSSSESSSPPTTRRGSVCHIEQRLQERHERKLEKERRMSAIELERSPLNERRRSKGMNLLSVNDDRPRSITPSRTRKSSRSDSAKGSDVSQASSMESVVGSLEDVHKNSRRRSKVSPPPSFALIKHTLNKEARKVNDVNDNVIPSSLVPSSNFLRQSSKDMDEAYASLEDNSKDISEVAQDEEKVGEGNEIKAETETQISTEKESTKDNEVLTNQQNLNNTAEDRKERKRSQVLADISDLSSIQEESSDLPKFIRSTSATSDLGSTFSEENEENKTAHDSTEIKPRTRSMSIQPSSFEILSTKIRARSNSVTNAPNDKSRPWGDLCNGSIAKALKNFTIQEDCEPKSTDFNKRTV